MNPRANHLQSAARGGLLYWALLAIGVATVVSGAVQLFAPSFILGLIGAESTPTGSYAFGIVGMFMVLFGGMLIHGLRSTPQQSSMILWAALQKFGASIAIGLAVGRGLFGTLAIAVGAFDLLSGVLGIWHWKRVSGR